MQYAIAVASLIAFSTVCSAREIEKEAHLTDHGMEFFWWPKLQAPKGWHHDEKQSLEMSSNVLVPEGKTFETAETVIYGRAFYEPDKKKRGTLKEFIAGDLAAFKEHQPNLAMTELKEPLKTFTGEKLRTFNFPTARTRMKRCATDRREISGLCSFSARTPTARSSGTCLCWLRSFRSIR